ncbi:MAG: hypothetical protein IPJ21_02415 [Sterolibacteriaceae bacterium]|nr:hypothetical protein [Sterolibacteriaceae bacterium]MBK9086514.1 hypothetical protein [Sterolibacteriaceae bacterium]
MGKHHSAEKRIEHGATVVAPSVLATPLADRNAPTAPALTFESSINPADRVRTNGYPTMRQFSVGKSATLPQVFIPFESFSRNPSQGAGTLGHASAGVIQGPGTTPAPAVVVVKDVVAKSVDCLVQFKDSLKAALEQAKRAADDPLGMAMEVGEGVWDGVKEEAANLIEAVKSLPEIAGAVKDILGDIYDGELEIDDLTEGMGDLLKDMLAALICDYAARMAQAATNPKTAAKEIGKISAEILVKVGASAATGGAGGAATTGGKVLGKAGKVGDKLKNAVRAAKNKRQAAKHGGAKPDTPKPNEPPSPKPEAGGKNGKDERSDNSSEGQGGPSSACKNCPTSSKPVNPILGIKVLFGEEELDFELPAPLPTMRR